MTPDSNLARSTPATTGLREWLREMSREAEAAAKGARTNAEAQWHLGQQHMADAVLTRLATDTVVERNDSPDVGDRPEGAIECVMCGGYGYLVNVHVVRYKLDRDTDTGGEE